MKTKIKFLLLLLCAGITTQAMAQPIRIAGKVLDQTKRPLGGAVVYEKGTTSGAITDSDGTYVFSTTVGKTLVFRSVGYQTQEHQVTAQDSVLQVIMEPDDQMVLQEAVVVTGLGGRKQERKLGYAATMVAAGRRASKQYDMAYAASPVVPYGPNYDAMDAEEYAGITENRFNSARNTPLSTFSLDVDGASYSNARRMLNSGRIPPADAVRVEEFVNYFSYDYPQPTGNDPVRINYEVGACPWNVQHQLVRIGVKARQIPSDNLPRSNFVFLIDVSGSMYGSRLDMVKSSMKLLVNNLREKDRVAIVVYAGAAGLALGSTPGSDKQKIREALDALEAGGSTAGAAGIKLAYEVARKNFVTGGNNRVILCTDGDFNVGVSSTGALETLIEQERKSGVYLTVLGYGMGNYKDAKMQTLAEKGNGNHAYIDDLQEAKRVLVNEFGSTMHTVAKDVKIQVEFNPATVQAYRLVGYESRLLRDEDFNDDTVDAGELGAGHTVTAFYEVVPHGVKIPRSVDPLKYQSQKNADILSEPGMTGELMTVKLRYKEPDGQTSRLMEAVVDNKVEATPSADFNFAAAAAMFAQLLRDSHFKGTATYDTVVQYARRGFAEDTGGYRREMVRLAEMAAQLK